MEKVLEKLGLSSDAGTQDLRRLLPSEVLPRVMRDRVLYISGNEISQHPFATVVVSCICGGYTEEQFQKDVEMVAEQFNLNEETILKLALAPIESNSKVLDSNRAVKDVNSLLSKLSSLRNVVNSAVVATTATTQNNTLVEVQATMHEFGDNIHMLRIVQVGIANTRFLLNTLQFLLSEWNSPRKSVQFVTNCDSEDTMLKFWKDACITGLCSEVQYVDGSDYFPFGFYKTKWRPLSGTK